MKKSERSLRVLIACGGTGGHIFPGIAIAGGLRARGHQAAVVVSEKKIDEVAMGKHPEIPVFKLSAIASPRLLSPRVFLFLVRFAGSAWKARSIIRGYAPHVIVGMGGFTSMPVVVAGRMLGIPTLLHDSNAIPGRANRLGARFATVVLIGWDAAAKHLKHPDVRTVGTPIRRELGIESDSGDCGAAFGLDPGKPVVLVIGGSQGARGLNRLIVGALPALAEGLPELQVLHLSGELDFDEVRAGYDGCPLVHHVAPFCQEMAKAYAIADLVVARSGASTLNELATFGFPSVLVPYPFAADHHQHANAKIFTDAGAALLADEEDTTPDGLAEMLLGILRDEKRRQAMSKAMRALAPDGATDLICAAIESVAE